MVYERAKMVTHSLKFFPSMEFSANKYETETF